VRWIIDAQLPPALARLLEQRGDEAEHVEDAGLREAEDNAIWQRALDHRAVIITKDEDFANRASVSRSAPCIVWLRIGNASRDALAAWLEARLPDIEARLRQGEKLIEVR
jgi:predicted nuclease of predicted toxin-antitoxin system